MLDDRNNFPIAVTLESPRVACVTAGPSSCTVMVRNLNMTNCRPLNPFRFCRKIIGPGLSSLIAIAVRTITGKKNNSAKEAKTISMVRLIKRCVPVRGARWISIANTRWRAEDVKCVNDRTCMSGNNRAATGRDLT